VEYDRSLRPLAVLERDGYRCQICGKDTPRHLRGKQIHNAPELDHILPLSRGGTHTWDNVQCACRACNREKHSKPFGQLQLFPRPVDAILVKPSRRRKADPDLRQSFMAWYLAPRGEPDRRLMKVLAFHRRGLRRAFTVHMWLAGKRQQRAPDLGEMGLSP
jgi:hypothetical protein